MRGYSVSTSTPGRVGRDWDMLPSNVSMWTLVSGVYNAPPNDWYSLKFEIGSNWSIQEFFLFS